MAASPPSLSSGGMSLKHAPHVSKEPEDGQEAKAGGITRVRALGPPVWVVKLARVRACIFLGVALVLWVHVACSGLEHVGAAPWAVGVGAKGPRWVQGWLSYRLPWALVLPACRRLQP